MRGVLSRPRRLALSALVVTAAVAAGLAMAARPPGTSRPATTRANTPVYLFHTDHATYGTLSEISAASDAIIVGQATSKTVEPGVSPGVDAEGDPLPALPHTNYTVTVARTIKGAIPSGSAVVVGLAGGKTAAEEVRPEEGYEIREGANAVFFLQANGNGRYYPLAGGAAIAEAHPDGTYELPPDAVQEVPIRFSEQELRNTFAPRSSGELIGGGLGSVAVGGRSDVHGAKAAGLIVKVRLAPHQTLTSALTRGVRLTTSCSPTRCTLAGKLSVSTRAAKLLKLGHRVLVVGSGTSSNGAALVLKLTKRARHAMGKLRRVTLSLSVAGDGAASTPATLKGTLTLTRRVAHLTG